MHTVCSESFNFISDATELLCKTMISTDRHSAAGAFFCRIFNVRNCGDVVNAFMQTPQKRAFLNNVDPDETPQKMTSHQGLCYLAF